MFDLHGKMAVVTGAAQGLGEVMALALAEAGADIVCVDMNIEGVRKTAKAVKKHKSRAFPLKVDISSQEDIKRMVKTAIRKFGRIDILVNNAGIHIGGDFPPEKLYRKFWDRTLEVNLTGTFLCSQAVGRQMIEQKKGKIINIASMSGIVVNRLSNRHPLSYCVSKAGVIMLTKVLAAEWAKYNITVNSIAPAYMKTAILHPSPEIRAEMVRDIPTGRLGKPEDLKGAVVYLASEESNFVTGHTLFVDGGYTVW